MPIDCTRDLEYERRVDTVREKLGLPSLNRAKDALRRQLLAKLSDAQFPIRNERELRHALGDDDRTDRVVALVSSRDYLFTSPTQLADLVAERAAAAWDLSARRRAEAGRGQVRDASGLMRLSARRRRRIPEQRSCPPGSCANP